MIGLLVTGHGRFGSGMVSAMEVIAGPAKGVEFVDFEADDSVGRLEEKLSQALESLLDACDCVLVLADLIGGSPFKSAVRIGVPTGKVEVVAGCNLGMLVEMETTRKFNDDVVGLAEQAAETGRSAIGHFKLRKKK